MPDNSDSNNHLLQRVMQKSIFA